MDCYNVKELLKFLGESSVGMNAKLKVAGGGEITRITYVPDEGIMYFDEENERKIDRLQKQVKILRDLLRKQISDSQALCLKLDKVTTENTLLHQELDLLK